MNEIVVAQFGELLALNAELEGMKAFNKERELNGYSIGYDQQSFQEVANKMRNVVGNNKMDTVAELLEYLDNKDIDFTINKNFADMLRMTVEVLGIRVVSEELNVTSGNVNSWINGHILPNEIVKKRVIADVRRCVLTRIF